MDSISIIIKVWNALEHVRLCLENLLEKTDYPFELILIDNGSRDSVVRYLRRLATTDSRIRLVENPENFGPGYANRQGFSFVENSKVCLVDSDVLVPYNWLTRLVRNFNESREIKMLSPMKYHETIAYPFEPVDSRQAWFKIKHKYHALSPLEQFHMYSNGLDIDAFDEIMRSTNSNGLQVLESPPSFMSTCCVLLDTAFVRTVGGIADSRFLGYGSEDVDLCWRIGVNGGLVAKTSSVYVHHFHNSSLIDNAVDVQKELLVANRILYNKWKPKLLDMLRLRLSQNKSPMDYLSKHYIFHPLSMNTSLIDDLRKEFYFIDIPDCIPWSPAA